MKITELARTIGRKVTVESSSHSDESWWAYIDKVGFFFGLVTVSTNGKTPQLAIEALAAAFNCKELCVDGNTDQKRYIGPVEITAA